MNISGFAYETPAILYDTEDLNVLFFNDLREVRLRHGVYFARYMNRGEAMKAVRLGILILPEDKEQAQEIISDKYKLSEYLHELALKERDI